ncbi:ribose 5-phosphate isomerase A [Segetibacter aerophilus]|uniref:Ribose 5-phosphate isomerase A n=1 Tax=Segetibacter aerophilus TaxID=670293 RepID=A0A512BDP6_9BACT|nr:ribose 5-phosphate isomerase A [Segetibacter aerophilus]GEO10091.1 ribose-5-phosphate isomerase [Segetibacter aerophilus]
MTDLKKLAAQKAATLVKDKTVVGLGAGSTIAHLVDFLNASLQSGLDLQFVTSSFSTLQLLHTKKLPVLQTEFLSQIDIYFDGCDQMDRQLNALKSGGGIHTQEKLLAAMAKEFVLIGDETKLVESFDLKYPVVLEILPQSAAFVSRKIEEIFQVAKMVMRMNDKKDGPVITENGNYLVDAYFESWPEIQSINPIFKNVPGIVETSLFYSMATKAIVAGNEGVVVLES